MNWVISCRLKCNELLPIKPDTMQHLPQFTWEYSRIWGQTQTYDCTGLEEIVSPLFFRACRCQRLSYPFHFWMKCSRQYKVFYAKPTTALLSSYLKPKWTLSLGTTETWTQPMLKLEEHLRKKTNHRKKLELHRMGVLLLLPRLSSLALEQALSRWGAINESNFTSHNATADDVWGIVGKHVMISSRIVLEPSWKLLSHNQSSLMAPTKSAST